MPSPSLPAHVLVIDDDPDLRTVVQEILTDEGYRVSSRGLSRDGDIAAFAALGPDLIITDSMGHAGDALIASLRSFRADPRLARTRIVLCTGAVRAIKDVDDVIAALGVRVVPKPFDTDRLLEVVAAALVGES